MMEEYDYKPLKIVKTNSRVSLKNFSSTPEKLRAFSKEFKSPYRSQLKSKRQFELKMI